MKTEYLAPDNLEMVLEALAKEPEETMLMAGGTALLWAVRLIGKSVNPGTVISLQNLKGILGQIEQGPETKVGALVSLATLAGEEAAARVPFILARACRSIGFPGIRRTATLGGNLANGVMPSQVLPSLAALGAGVHVRSISGSRRIDLEKGVAGGAYYPIASAGELITSITFPGETIQAPQSFLDFSWPSRDPVAMAAVLCRGRLRVSVLADQKLSLWTTEPGSWSKERGTATAEAACEFFGRTPSTSVSPIDAYRRRAMIIKLLGLITHQGPSA